MDEEREYTFEELEEELVWEAENLDNVEDDDFSWLFDDPDTL